MLNVGEPLDSVGGEKVAGNLAVRGDTRRAGTMTLQQGMAARP
jgi:hypothetical protein